MAHNTMHKETQIFIVYLPYVYAEIEAAEKLQTGLKGIGLKDVAIPDRRDKVVIE